MNWRGIGQYAQPAEGVDFLELTDGLVRNTGAAYQSTQVKDLTLQVRKNS